MVTNRRLLESVPEIAVSTSALEQTVGWSTAKQRPVSLREFIGARASKRVKAALDITPAEVSNEQVKRVTELTGEELRETACALLREGSSDIRLAVAGDGVFSVDEL